MKKSFSSLNKNKILSNLDKNLIDLDADLLISDSTGSTNDDAKDFLADQSNILSFHITEQQIAGKGRNGKKWVSPKGRNIYLSTAWITELNYTELDGLSLATGIVVAKSLNKYANNQIKLKWPNDLLVNNKKISGVLIETIDLDSKLGVVIGIGVNIHMNEAEGKDIDQSWATLDGISNKIHDRNEILGDLISGIRVMTEDFSRKGFKAFKADFEKLDLLMGKKCKVEIKGTDKIVEASGVNDKGELVVKDNLEYLTLRYGQVSIREL